MIEKVNRADDRKDIAKIRKVVDTFATLATSYIAEVPAYEPSYEAPATTYEPSYEAPATTYSAPSEGVTLSNGNTAGEIGSYAAAQMAAATGVPQATWEYIIARESNGDPSAYNPSGASGLFQTMPFWGDTSSVDAQIDTALRAYNAAQSAYGNGLQPWGY